MNTFLLWRKLRSELNRGFKESFHFYRMKINILRIILAFSPFHFHPSICLSCQFFLHFFLTGTSQHKSINALVQCVHSSTGDQSDEVSGSVGGSGGRRSDPLKLLISAPESQQHICWDYLSTCYKPLLLARRQTWGFPPAILLKYSMFCFLYSTWFLNEKWQENKSYNCQQQCLFDMDKYETRFHLLTWIDEQVQMNNHTQ